MNVQDFLWRIHNRLEGVRHARELYAPRLAPNFNSLALLRPDEVRLSMVLADLLSPKGVHEQGPLFLELFLKQFELDKFLPNIAQAKVGTEIITDRIAKYLRRMDILIDLGETAIAIENKPWALDQDEQIKDYLTQLNHTHPDGHCLIYLSGTGNAPSEKSLPSKSRESLEAEEKFKIIDYSKLFEWLRDCRIHCQADRVGAFLNEFSDYIQRQFMGINDMTEIEQIANTATETPDTVRTALKVAQAQHEIKQRLLQRFEQQLRKQLNPNWNLEWAVDYNGKWSGIAFDFSRTPNSATLASNTCRLWFEFAGPECGQLVYGIWKPKSSPVLPEITACLDRTIGKGRQNQWWLWYRTFDVPFDDWRQKIEPWHEIANERLAPIFIERIEAIHEALHRENLLTVLDGD
jgi:hypothetical protein